MFCTRLRLNERRFRVISSVAPQNVLATSETTASAKETAASLATTMATSSSSPNYGPFVRPCAMANVVNACSLQTATIDSGSSISNENGDGSTESTPMERTPRSERSTGRPLSTNRTTKTPLMVVTLYIPFDTQTLAPKQIKRAPRKQPSYCQNFKTSAMQYEKENNNINRSTSSSPKFFIKGNEFSSASTDDDEQQQMIINQSSNDRCGDNDNDNDNEDDDDDINGKNETCCTCLLDGSDHIDDEFTMLAKTELLLNFDGYEMDTFGHLPGDSRTPTPPPIRRTTAAVAIDGVAIAATPRCRVIRRACSPSTGQVIRVTMNNKNGKRR